MSACLSMLSDANGGQPWSDRVSGPRAGPISAHFSPLSKMNPAMFASLLHTYISHTLLCTLDILEAKTRWALASHNITSHTVKNRAGMTEMGPCHGRQKKNLFASLVWSTNVWCIKLVVLYTLSDERHLYEHDLKCWSHTRLYVKFSVGYIFWSGGGLGDFGRQLRKLQKMSVLHSIRKHNGGYPKISYPG